MCHLILLSPVFGLVIFWFWPLWIALPIYAVICLLSVLLYLATVRMMRMPQITGKFALVQHRGSVIDVNDRGPLVRIGGEIWQANCAEPVSVGDQVKVIAQDGMTLRVERAA